jgi:hypothetical protein
VTDAGDIVDVVRGQSDWFKSLPKGATTRITPDLAEDISAVLDIAVNEIERLRAELVRTQKIACDNFARRATVNASKRARWFAEQMKWECFKEESR